MMTPLAIASYRLPLIALAVLAVLPGPMMTGSTAAAASPSQSRGSTSYVFFTPGGRDTAMSGSIQDMERARSLRSGSEGLLYIRDGNAAYVIRDAATLRQAELAFEPQNALGAQQGELGSRQGALGRRQAELGREQAQLGVRQANASPGRVRDLGRQQAALGQRQAELGRQQAELGRQQAALGREQARLGRLAAEKLRTLLAEAIRRGVAQRVR